jgi:hypothetical protein
MNSIQMLAIGVALAAFTTSAAHPAQVSCSIHPAKGTSDQALEKLAKVSKEAAQTTALHAVKNSSTATVASAELEAENGCLIWSFDVKQKYVRGIQEVTVDAGTGKVLTSTHETPRDETVEKAQEAAEIKK